MGLALAGGGPLGGIYEVGALLALTDSLDGIDFGDLEANVRPVIATLDHHLLNDVEGLSNPTSEILAVWLFDKLCNGVPQLSAVTVRETTDSAATYRANQ